jgi:hypothetical protein
MKKTPRLILSLITAALAGALLLSGCMTVNSETNIKSDGSGSRSIILAVDPNMLGLASQQGAVFGQGPQGPFGPVTSAVSKIPGAKIEPYKDAGTGQQGIKMSIPFKSLDDLKSQQLGGKGQAVDTIVSSKAGNVITLSVTVNTDQISVAASSAAGVSAYTTPSPSDQAMAAQMMSSLGVQVIYAIAVPGKILDWQPKANAGYDPGINKITWNVDLTSGTIPNLMVKWDNSQKPQPIQAPAVPAVSAGPAAAVPPMIPGAPSIGTSSTGSSIGLNTLQKYAMAQSSGDQATYGALFVGGKALSHPLTQKYPKLFSAQDIKVTYSTLIADNQSGMAQWTAQWTANGKPQTLTGVDVLGFDANGKIAGIQSFVDPGQFLTLQGGQ